MKFLCYEPQGILLFNTKFNNSEILLKIVDLANY